MEWSVRGGLRAAVLSLSALLITPGAALAETSTIDTAQLAEFRWITHIPRDKEFPWPFE